jgi:hypothetical protein
MQRVILKDISSPFRHITIKELSEGYVLHIRRYNVELIIYACGVFLVGIAFLFTPVYFISFLLFYFAYWIYSFTLGFLEIRFYDQIITFIWDDEIKKRSLGKKMNILAIKRVELQTESGKHGDYNAFIKIELKNNKMELLSCVDPEYHPFISIFIKKYIHAYHLFSGQKEYKQPS